MLCLHELVDEIIHVGVRQSVGDRVLEIHAPLSVAANDHLIIKIK